MGKNRIGILCFLGLVGCKGIGTLPKSKLNKGSNPLGNWASTVFSMTRWVLVPILAMRGNPPLGYCKARSLIWLQPRLRLLVDSRHEESVHRSRRVPMSCHLRQPQTGTAPHTRTCHQTYMGIITGFAPCVFLSLRGEPILVEFSDQATKNIWVMTVFGPCVSFFFLMGEPIFGHTLLEDSTVGLGPWSACRFVGLGWDFLRQGLGPCRVTYNSRFPLPQWMAQKQFEPFVHHQYGLPKSMKAKKPQRVSLGRTTRQTRPVSMAAPFSRLLFRRHVCLKPTSRPKGRKSVGPLTSWGPTQGRLSVGNDFGVWERTQRSIKKQASWMVQQRSVPLLTGSWTSPARVEAVSQ